MASNPQPLTLTNARRRGRDDSRGFVLWLTGLPCSGKTSLALALEEDLRARGDRVELLDGDEVRAALWPDLGFSAESRHQNVRRVGYIARLLARNGVVTIVAAVSPYRSSRREAQTMIETAGSSFLEVHVTAPREVLLARDVKGMYRRALAGEIANFTGISAAYEPPEAPDLVIESHRETLAACRDRILEELFRRGLVARSRVLAGGAVP